MTDVDLYICTYDRITFEDPILRRYFFPNTLSSKMILESRNMIVIMIT